MHLFIENALGKFVLFIERNWEQLSKTLKMAFSTYTFVTVVKYWIFS